MRDPIILLVHLIATLARLMGPGGSNAQYSLVKMPIQTCSTRLTHGIRSGGLG